MMPLAYREAGRPGIESAYLVAQDRGTALAFHLAARRPDFVRGMAFMQFIRPMCTRRSPPPRLHDHPVEIGQAVAKWITDITFRANSTGIMIDGGRGSAGGARAPAQGK